MIEYNKESPPELDRDDETGSDYEDYNEKE